MPDANDLWLLLCRHAKHSAAVKRRQYDSMLSVLITVYDDELLCYNWNGTHSL